MIKQSQDWHLGTVKLPCQSQGLNLVFGIANKGDPVNKYLDKCVLQYFTAILLYQKCFKDCMRGHFYGQYGDMLLQVLCHNAITGINFLPDSLVLCLQPVECLQLVKRSSEISRILFFLYW